MVIPLVSLMVLVFACDQNLADDESIKPENVVEIQDADGTVHYGDSIPPQFAEQPYELLNDQGVSVQEPMPQEMPCTREQIEKHREDIRRYQDDLERLQDGPEQYRSKEKEDSLARSE